VRRAPRGASSATWRASPYMPRLRRGLARGNFVLPFSRVALAVYDLVYVLEIECSNRDATQRATLRPQIRGTHPKITSNAPQQHISPAWHARCRKDSPPSSARGPPGPLIRHCPVSGRRDLTRYYPRQLLVLSRRRTAGRRYLGCHAGTAHVVTSASPSVSIGARGLDRPARSPHDPRLGQ
jgi:hypothetical protein